MRYVNQHSVINLDTGEEYRGLVDAAMKLNCSKIHVFACIKNEEKCNGYRIGFKKEKKKE